MDDEYFFGIKVSQEIPAKLLMIGDGPERQPAEKLARSLCPNLDVRFLGKQEAVEDAGYCRCVFIAVRKREFWLAALEAMACEVPVVSSNAGGIPEVNIDGQTGFFIERRRR